MRRIRELMFTQRERERARYIAVPPKMRRLNPPWMIMTRHQVCFTRVTLLISQRASERRMNVLRSLGPKIMGRRRKKRCLTTEEMSNDSMPNKDRRGLKGKKKKHIFGAGETRNRWTLTLSKQPRFFCNEEKRWFVSVGQNVLGSSAQTVLPQ